MTLPLSLLRSLLFLKDSMRFERLRYLSLCFFRMLSSLGIEGCITFGGAERSLRLANLFHLTWHFLFAFGALNDLRFISVELQPGGL